ncbi:hypothetical protein SANTM175S_05470 [Streptomyces antimycoticus]
MLHRETGLACRLDLAERDLGHIEPPGPQRGERRGLIGLRIRLEALDGDVFGVPVAGVAAQARHRVLGVGHQPERAVADRFGGQPRLVLPERGGADHHAGLPGQECGQLVVGLGEFQDHGVRVGGPYRVDAGQLGGDQGLGVVLAALEALLDGLGVHRGAVGEPQATAEGEGEAPPVVGVAPGGGERGLGAALGVELGQPGVDERQQMDVPALGGEHRVPAGGQIPAPAQGLAPAARPGRRHPATGG